MAHDTTTLPARLHRAAILARLAAILALVVMFLGTHAPAEISNEIAYHDKLVHFWAYMTLAFLVVASWDLSAGGLRRFHLLVVMLAGAAYGALDELSQIPVGRSCDLADWICDIAGVAVGLALFRVLRPLIYRAAMLVPAPARA